MAYTKTSAAIKLVERYLDELSQSDNNLVFNTENPDKLAVRLRNAALVAEEQLNPKYGHIRRKYIFKIIRPNKVIASLRVPSVAVEHPEIKQEEFNLSPNYIHVSSALEIIQYILLNDQQVYCFAYSAPLPDQRKLDAWYLVNSSIFGLEIDLNTATITINRL